MCCGLIRIVQIPITLVTAPWRSGGTIFTEFMWLREALVSKLTNLIDVVLPSRASSGHFHIKLYNKMSIANLVWKGSGTNGRGNVCINIDVEQ